MASKKSRNLPQYDGPIRAAVYCRVSSEKQVDGSSLLDQEVKCREFATQQGWLVSEHHVYREVFSGAYLGRDQLELLREAIRYRQIDRVIVLAGDRFGRDTEDRIYLRVEAKRFGVAWCSVLGDLGDDTPEGQLISYVSGYAARMEREAIKRRTRSGLEQRVASGKRLVGAKAPYGYGWIEEPGQSGKPVKTRLEVNEPEAEVVRLMFSRVLKGDSLNQIAKDLTLAGVPTPNPARAKAGTTPKWLKTSLHCILRNPIYAGNSYSFMVETRVEDAYTGAVSHRLRPEKDWKRVGDDVTPLVSLEVWQRVQEQLAIGRERSRRSSSDLEDALLRGGIARCGYCGTALHVRRARGHVYYACKSEYPKPGCRSSDGRAWGAAISANKLDDEVWNAAVLILANPAMVRSKLAMTIKEDTGRKEYEALHAQMKEVRRQQQNVTNAIGMNSSSAMASSLMTKYDELEQRWIDLNRRSWPALNTSWLYQAALRDADALINWGLANSEGIQTLDYREKRSRLEAINAVIEVFRPEEFSGRWQLAFNLKGVNPGDFKRGADTLTQALNESASTDTRSADADETQYISASNTRPRAAR